MPHSVLVLAGGGARGIIQAGMIQAYLASNPMPSHIVGVSVGALNGYLLAQERLYELVQIWTDIRNSHVYKWNWLNAFGAKASLADDAPLARLINQASRLQLLIPFYAVCTDLSIYKATYHEFPFHRKASDLDLQYLLASASAQALFPVRRLPGANGRILVDGGMSDNFPLDFASSLDAERIVIMTPSVPTPGPIRNILDMLEAMITMPEWIQFNLDFRIAQVLQKTCVEVHLYQPKVSSGLSLLDFDAAGKNSERYLKIGYDTVAAGPRIWR
jgi:NTE family protein